MTEPLILKVRTSVPESEKPKATQVYDPKLQLWINTDSGKPIVTEMSNDLNASQFGETTETRAPEGVDRPVQSELLSSNFGETSITKTSGEGADQSSEVLHASQFGETSITESGEGADSAESISDDIYAFNSLL